jgi:hypothetical protein
MSMTDLANAIAKATRDAYVQLRREYPGEYYYFVLTTTWDGTAPAIAAWSRESLEQAIQGSEDKEDAEWGLKWSYADSPFLCYGDEYFDEVRSLFAHRTDLRTLSGEARARELGYRVDAMVDALKSLDLEGLFGTGDDRNRIFINVELNPPDASNTTRAEALNPLEARREWVSQMAEPM